MATQYTKKVCFLTWLLRVLFVSFPAWNLFVLSFSYKKLFPIFGRNCQTLLSISLNFIITFFELCLAREGWEVHTECCGWVHHEYMWWHGDFFVLFFISYDDSNISFYLFLISAEQWISVFIDVSVITPRTLSWGVKANWEPITIYVKVGLLSCSPLCVYQHRVLPAIFSQSVSDWERFVNSLDACSISSVFKVFKLHLPF